MNNNIYNSKSGAITTSWLLPALQLITNKNIFKKSTAFIRY